METLLTAHIKQKHTVLALCVFFVLLSVLPAHGNEWRLKISPNELKELSANEVGALLQKATNDTDRLKLNFFLANKIHRTDIDSALSCLHAITVLREKTNFAIWDAYIARSSGIIYSRKGEWEKAMQFFADGIAIAESRKDSSEVAHILRQVGHIYKQKGNAEKAREHYSRSLVFHDPGLVGSFSIKLFKMREQGRYADIIALMKKRIPTAEKNAGVFKLLQLIANIGFSYTVLHEHDSATLYLAKAESLANSVGHDLLLTDIYNHQGMLFQEEGKNSIAIGLYRKALNKGKELHSLPILINSYEHLANAYKSLKEYKIANAYLDSFILFSDSMDIVSNAKKIAEVEAKYQTARKDKQIAEEAKKRQLAEAEAKQKTLLLFGVGGVLVALLVLVFFYARQRKAKERQHNAELEQKALRAQMNPHFIFNSLASMQQLYTEGKTEQANDFMADFGQLLRGILDSTGKRFIPLKEELEILRQYLQLEKNRLGKVMDYEVTIIGDVDENNLYIPPVVIQPFVENAIWHGIVPKGKGKVTIEITQETVETITCKIIDDGVGMDKTQLNNPNSKGINLTKERLKGKVDIQSTKGKGTTVIIKIPAVYED